MRKANWVGVAILITTSSGLVLGQPGQPAKPAQPAPPAKPAQPGEPEVPKVEQRVNPLGPQSRGAMPNSLRARIALTTKLPEAEVGKVLDAMGPAVKDLLGQGQSVELANLGIFRIVRVPEHRDLVNGRPATIAGSNYVEFVPTGAFTNAGNQAGVRPAETVPPFEYNPLPGQTQSLKTGPTRQPNNRAQ